MKYRGILTFTVFAFILFTTHVEARKKRVGFVFALDFEAQPFINQLGLVRDYDTTRMSENLPTIAYEGEHNGVIYRLIYGGLDAASQPIKVQNIGPESATVSALVLLQKWRPDVIVSAGTAGGWSDKHHVGDIIVCANNQTVKYYDRRMDFRAGYGAYGIGNYPCASVPTSILQANNVSLGLVGTSASYTPSPTDITFLNAWGVDVVDMEAAAVAYIAKLFDIPFFALKVVSNSYAYPNDPYNPNANAIAAQKTIAILEATEF